jgi:FtsP/CotA-like multicopper oxidase with cupredoxin domain
LKKQNSNSALSRRQALKLGIGVGGTAMLPVESLDAKRQDRNEDSESSEDNGLSLPFQITPWIEPLVFPKCAQGRDPGTANALLPKPGDYPAPRYQAPHADGPGPTVPGHGYDKIAHGIAPEFDTSHPGYCPEWNKFADHSPHHKEYKLVTEETTQQIIPGVHTPVFVYRDAFAEDQSLPGTTPGPTFISHFRGPAVIRNENHLTGNRHLEGNEDVNTTHHNHETSIHMHGSHSPAHSDGYPDFYVLAGETRDYFYTNSAPPRMGEGCDTIDETWIPSTLWYHDHAMDVTGFNVSRGLAGFYLVFDDRELELILNGTLPAPGREALKCLDITDEAIISPLLGEPGENDEGFDFGLALQDQHFNPDGSLSYDFLDHAGRIGNVFTVNGKAQPYFNVQRRKYRFRILNASNARNYQLRLSSGQAFTVFGADSWLFPEAAAVDDFELAMGQRHDVIIDFSDYPDNSEVFLENIMIQEDGRKGKKVDPDEPTPLLKFIVKGQESIPDDVTIEHGTTIRGYASDPGGQWAPISADEIVESGVGSMVSPREFRFDRGGGVWTTNNRFFNPRRADAVPTLDTAECWLFKNGGGGWWHPFHTHLEGFQVQSLDGKAPAFERSFNCDLVNLHGGEEAKIFIKFRSFTGPYVFHCHNIEHEDMRMMAVHDPRPAGEASPLDGESMIDPQVSGVVPECIELEEEGFLYFDVEGDLESLDDRGVGFPECEFDMDKRGNG